MFRLFGRYHGQNGVDFSNHPVTLVFRDNHLESRFKETYFKNNLQIGRACHLIAIFFYCLVGMWDASIIDPSRLHTWIWVLPAVSSVFLAGLASSYFALKYYARYWQQFFAFYVFITGLGFTVVTMLSSPNYPVYNFVGIIFCLFFCYTFIRLTFLWAVAAGNSIVFLYVAAVAFSIGPSSQILMTNFFYIFGINLLGMMVCYSLELMARRDFILNDLLLQEENKTKDLNAHLEQMVKERTRALDKTNQELMLTIEREKKLAGQLIQAQKMESVGRLAGGIAHDYNNISSAIIGYAELSIDQMDPDDPEYENLEQILIAARRATEITRQLLAFARKQPIDPKVIDLNKTIQSMLMILKRIIGEDIELSWHPGDEIWPLKIDPSQIDQILANLCVNARDAIFDTGKIIIETKNIFLDEKYCEDHTEFVPGDYSLLAVSDDGKGIDPETMDKIFEPFFTTKDVGQGTGLGLATVYGIVKQNQGFVNVYSEVNEGTTIKIFLPRHEGPIINDSARIRVGNPEGKGETVLFVEDDKSLLNLGRKILDSLGYVVLTAGSPGEALKLVENTDKKIHVLITDVVMPEMNGRELSKKLQSICPDLKTLYMSGYTANVIAHRGVLEKGVNFISKPFSKKEFAFKIRTAIENSSD